ncbi:MAG: DUF421 domain-containing protein [Clostridia bacterium]|nr:DUF421 domain-containing protein [Clostridia bacterium]
MITLIIRSIIVYCIVLFAVRIMGKRQIGDLQPFELVVTLIIADLACIPMSDSTIPIVFGIVPLLTLVVLHHIFTFLNRKSIIFRKIINGKPVIVIDKDGINYSALKKLNMTLNDLTEGLRGCQCFDINEVAYAIVETNGNISVMLKSNCQPVSNENMKLNIEEASITLMLINDGKIIKENLTYFGLDEEFLFNIIRQEKINNIKDILILTIDKQGEIFFQEKNKPCKTIKAGKNK